MGLQPLSLRTLRRVVRTTGLPVLYGSGAGGYWHHIVTRDHRHFYWHTTSGEWEWVPDAAHSTTCTAVFGGGATEPVSAPDVARPLLPVDDLARALTDYITTHHTRKRG